MGKQSTSPFTFAEAYAFLTEIGQQHLLEGFAALTHSEQSHLLTQITHLDSSLIKRMQACLKQESLQQEPFEPFYAFEKKGSLEDQEQGLTAISKGKCASLIVAGGQGSRLRFEGPKGCFPVSPIKKKSLFQLVIERVSAASKQADYPLECAIMTSPMNHASTACFFDQQGFYSLPPERVHFFFQDIWPLLDFEGKLFFDKPGSIAWGPNGNGGAFYHLLHSGILEKWKKKGVECVFFSPIDNALAFPFDAELVGFHLKHGNEITIKTTFRKDPQENVGILVKRGNSCQVIEYSEFPAEEKGKMNGGALLHPLANLSLFCFSLSFLEKALEKKLPLHAAKKAAKVWKKGTESFPMEPNAWKFEEFIFDLLPLASRVKALVYPREECYAPLKNLKGKDSIETVQEALLAADQRTFQRISGTDLPKDAVFELAQDFYYPTKAIVERWKGNPLPLQDYIEAL